MATPLHTEAYKYRAMSVGMCALVSLFGTTSRRWSKIQRRSGFGQPVPNPADREALRDKWADWSLAISAHSCSRARNISFSDGGRKLTALQTLVHASSIALAQELGEPSRLRPLRRRGISFSTSSTLTRLSDGTSSWPESWSTFRLKCLFRIPTPAHLRQKSLLRRSLLLNPEKRRAPRVHLRSSVQKRHALYESHRFSRP